MDVVGPREMSRVLQALDALGLHREAVRVPLSPVSGGGLRIEGAALVVEVPSDGDLQEFLEALPERARALPGFAALKPAEEGP